MKRTLLAVIFCAAAGIAAAQSTSTAPLRLTLEECIDYAMGNNYGRQSAALNEDIRQNALDQSKMERLPSLSASLSENVSNTKGTDAVWKGAYDLSAGMTISQGGQINQTIKQNDLQLQQTRLQTEQYDNELTIQILQSFLTALGNEELLKYQEVVVEASRRQMDDGKEKFAVGQIIESDYLLLEAQYASDLNNITETRINLDNSLVALKNLMSMDLSRPLELIYPDTTAMEKMLAMPSRDYVLEKSMVSLPDIRISDYSVEIAETGLRISQSSYYPTVSLNGSIGTGHNTNFQNFGTQLSDRFNQQAGISVSIPIFNRNRTRASVTQSRISLQQAELDRKQTVMSVEQTIINEYGSVVSAASKYRSSDVKQNAYLRSFEAYTEMFNAGSITTVELLQQQNNYINAMNDYVQSKYSFMLQRKILDVYMGERIEM